MVAVTLFPKTGRRHNPAIAVKEQSTAIALLSDPKLTVLIQKVVAMCDCKAERRYQWPRLNSPARATESYAQKLVTALVRRRFEVA